MNLRVEEYGANKTTTTVAPALKPADGKSRLQNGVLAEIVYTAANAAPEEKKQASIPSLPKPFYPSPSLTGTIGDTALQIYFEFEDATAESLDHAKKRLETRAGLLDALNKEQLEALTEHIHAGQYSAKWGIFKGVVTCVAAASAIVLGAYLIWPAAIGGVLFASATATATAAAGNAWGWALIASGVMSILGNEILPRLAFFDKMAALFTNEKETQTKLALYFRSGISIISAALGIAGGIATASSLMGLINSSVAIKIGQTSLQLASGVANLASGLAERRELLMKATMLEKGAKTGEEKHQFDQEAKNFAAGVESYNGGYSAFANFFSSLLNCYNIS